MLGLHLVVVLVVVVRERWMVLYWDGLWLKEVPLLSRWMRDVGYISLEIHLCAHGPQAEDAQLEVLNAEGDSNDGNKQNNTDHDLHDEHDEPQRKPQDVAAGLQQAEAAASQGSFN